MPTRLLRAAPCRPGRRARSSRTSADLRGGARAVGRAERPPASRTGRGALRRAPPAPRARRAEAARRSRRAPTDRRRARSRPPRATRGPTPPTRRSARSVPLRRSPSARRGGPRPGRHQPCPASRGRSGTSRRAPASRGARKAPCRGAYGLACAAMADRATEIPTKATGFRSRNRQLIGGTLAIGVIAATFVFVLPRIAELPRRVGCREDAQLAGDRRARDRDDREPRHVRPELDVCTARPRLPPGIRRHPGVDRVDLRRPRRLRAGDGGLRAHASRLGLPTGGGDARGHADGGLEPAHHLRVPVVALGMLTMRGREALAPADDGADRGDRALRRDRRARRSASGTPSFARRIGDFAAASSRGSSASSAESR